MLNVIEYQGQRVLTTAQLATAFATTHNTIKNVFAHAKQQFQSDRHFFLLEGTPLRALKATPAAAAALPKFVSCLYLWTEQGAALLANLLANPQAFDELKRVYFEAEPRHDADNTRQIVVIEGVHGYNGDDGFVYLDAEDVARGLGFVQVHNERVTTSGYNYSAVRWERINGYLADFDCPPIKKGDFIPESMFYLLAMKANNETAKKFQLKIANKILPSIRKHGYYVNEPVQGTLFPEPPPVVDFGFTCLYNFKRKEMLL